MAQYTYFENVVSSLDENGSKSSANLEILEDSIYIFGGELIDGFLFQFFEEYSEEGVLMDQSSLFFADALVYTGLTNSFKRINGADAFLFVQGILDAINTRGIVMKVDANLDTIWSREFDQYAPETYFYTFAQEVDGFILAGEHGPEPGERGTFLMKIDFEGMYLWDAIIHQPSEGVFRNVDITPVNGGYLLSGATGGGDSTEGYIEFVNSDNNIEWHTEVFEGSINGIMHHGLSSTEDILVFQGISYGSAPNPPDETYQYFKTRISSIDMQTGELTTITDLFTEQEIVRGTATKMIEAEDGLIFFGGNYVYTNGIYHRVSNIFKLNLDFELEWFTELAYDPCTSCTNQIWDMEQAPDGGYVLVGRFRDLNTDPHDKTWLVKVDACGDLEYNGCWPVGVQEIQEPIPFSISPNPVQDILTIEWSKEADIEALEMSGLRIVITDPLGREVKQIKSIHTSGRINVSTLPKGLYTLNIQGRKTGYKGVHFVKE